MDRHRRRDQPLFPRRVPQPHAGEGPAGEGPVQGSGARHPLRLQGSGLDRHLRRGLVTPPRGLDRVHHPKSRTVRQCHFANHPGRSRLPLVQCRSWRLQGQLRVARRSGGRYSLRSTRGAGAMPLLRPRRRRQGRQRRNPARGLQGRRRPHLVSQHRRHFHCRSCRRPVRAGASGHSDRGGPDQRCARPLPGFARRASRAPRFRSPLHRPGILSS